MLWENLAPRKPQQYYIRLQRVAVGVTVAMALLLLRLAWMQLWMGKEYRSQAENNATRTVPWRAPRGLLLDRHLRVLVSNQPALSLGLTPAELLRRPEMVDPVIQRLASLTGLGAEEIHEKFVRQSKRPFAPARLSQDLDRAMLGRLEERRDQLPGMMVIADSKRVYPLPLAAHVLGYVGEISEKQLDAMEDQGYRMGDMVGQTGLEAVYDQVLKGEDGGRQVRIDAHGHELSVLAETQPRTGNSLVLTLDAALQQVAEDQMGRNAGAIVALDPRNGDVLAMVSKPDFQSSDFSGRVKHGVWSRLLQDERTPFTNRAIQGVYPPGSVFKVVTAAAALETGAVTPQWRAECYGIFYIANWPYRCWKETGHGAIAIEQAITESCDIYFYQAGLRTKVQALHDYSVRFGLGRKTGVDLPGEKAGLVPDAAWKENTQSMPWFPGNTIMMSIGQGYLQVTPLQMATVAAAIANGGTLWKPHLVSRVTSPEGELVSEVKPQKMGQVALSPETLRLIQRGMTKAVDERRGTAWRARVEGVSVAGKTGTIQNPPFADHAAFVAFAPVENPQIAIAVLVENAGSEGGVVAAPMAKAMLDAYFGK
ncbi:MAG: penicillin-binding protein 2 [candidate division FCPU426 bacterium]